MKRPAITAIVWLLAAWTPCALGNDEVQTLVAVSSGRSVLAGLKPTDLRLAFLSVPIGQGAARARPVLNHSSPLLYEVFLQKVVFLSSEQYQRQLVAHVFRSGGTRPMSVETEEQLVRLLREDPQRVSFMWARDAARHADIKVVKVLWQGAVR